MSRRDVASFGEKCSAEIVGRVETIAEKQSNVFEVRISLAAETVGRDPGQFLNMLFGNTSLHEDVVLADVTVPKELIEAFGGPRHGLDALRRRVGAPARALTASPLKPIGSGTVSSFTHQATLSINTLAGGTHTITAVYRNNPPNFSASPASNAGAPSANCSSTHPRTRPPGSGSCPPPSWSGRPPDPFPHRKRRHHEPGRHRRPAQRAGGDPFGRRICR